ncbi:4-coumarate--CoA ligase-like 7 [Acorus gramineus]|uniref:4-coumarate--CoA ligase n=1 Tax=Acorus gramineus TaxID=55184 RepID=A0AAV9ARC5_ACOGR|nr:4-coumarate--CoA ligase-like 7 [Acorus gramineus]
MADTKKRTDPQSGYCAETKTFHSLRPSVPLPPESQPLSFPSFALSLLRHQPPSPSTPAFIFPSSISKSLSLSFSDFLSLSNSLSLSLRVRLRLSKGDVAFLLSPLRLEIPVLSFSLLQIGVVLSPSNPLSSPSEISRQIRLSRPTIAFATSSTAASLPPDLPVVLIDSDHFQSMFIRAGLKDPPPPIEEIRQSDTAAILFSSGTTGRSKAAAIPHRSFISMVAGFQPERAEVKMVLAPLFHTMGLILCLGGVALGETTVMAPAGRFEVGTVAAAVAEHGVTVLAVAPPVLVALERGAAEGIVGGLESLQRIIVGGAPLSRQAAERFVRRFRHVWIQQGYGSTEAGGIAVMMREDEWENYESVGKIAKNLEAKIVDPVTGEVLGVGQQGELWLRGPFIMKGYINDDDANASTFTSDSWLKTGDLCRFDENGYLYIVDRIKELIKYKAYQIPPMELELILLSLPQITDAAVIPYPHEEAGEIPMAYVVKRPGCHIDEATIMDFVARQVAPYKKIRRVAFVDSIPKSPTGKVLRRELVSHAISASASKL